MLEVNWWLAFLTHWLYGLLTRHGIRHCSPSSLNSSLLFPISYSYLAFSQIAIYLHLPTERPFPPFLLIVVCPEGSVLSSTLCLLSSMIFSLALLTRHLILLSILKLLPSFASTTASLLLGFESVPDDLKRISRRIHPNFVKFNPLKTHLLQIFLSEKTPALPISFDRSKVTP